MSDAKAKPRPIVTRPEMRVPLKEAVRLTGMSESQLRILADTGVIDTIRDENNERRFDRDSLARFMFLRKQNAAAAIQKRTGQKLAAAIKEGRARK